MAIVDEHGNKISTIEVLMDMFQNSKTENGVAERVLGRNEDGTFTWEEKMVTKVVLKSK